MNTQFPDARMESHDASIDVPDLPDPHDRHVLAAAIIGRCDGLITFNLKDFPVATVRPYRIDVVHPDGFVANLIDLAENRALAAFRRHREAMTQSKPDAANYLARVKSCGLLQSHQRLSALIDQI